MASYAPRRIGDYKTTWGCSRCGCERGSPYGVLEQRRDFWKKSQDDEITICPPLFGPWTFQKPHPCRAGVGEREKWAWGAAED